MESQRITPTRRSETSRETDPKRELAQTLGKLIGLAIVILIAVLIVRYCSPEPDIHFKVADRVAAIDGDTLRSGSVELRLYGIDAPELNQTCTRSDGTEWPCGREAQSRLKSLIGRYAVDCEPRSRDKFNRVVAVCGTSKVPDLAEALVRDGLAVTLEGSSAGPYADAEIAAERAKTGLWQGSFEKPWDWRLRHPREESR
jgi:endonuclease YncB( thermonuclease family)